MIRFLFLIVGVCLFWGDVRAQDQRQEFIESSSPLAGGGRIVSRSTAGGEPQTFVVGGSTSPLRLPPPQSAGVQSDATVQQNSTFRQSLPTPSGNQQAPAIRYPYPAGNPLSTGNLNQRPALFHQPVRAIATCTDCETPYQIPTLGLGSAVRTARQSFASRQQNCFPATRPASAVSVTAAQSPVLRLQQPADQIPSLSVEDPGQIGASPGAAVRAGDLQTNGFFSPAARQAGAYQPVIRLANLPPGTYLGQGIVGQPTAYVDGQPIRNLLRYISP